MAIDFRLVKSLTIPEGSVKSITDSNGVIIWNSKVLVSIAVSGATTTFNVGNTWVFGGTVTATYSDGTTADVTTDTTFSGYNMSTAGTQTVTATYTESGVTATATYNITVYKVLTSITLSGQTTSLNRGAAFSFGGTVTAHYNDNSTANVTSSSTFSGYNMSKAGTYTVTVSYTYRSVTKTATYNLTVNKAWTQLWSGTKQISWDLTNDNPPSNVTVYSNSSLPNTSDIRITFTMSNKSGSGTNGYLKNWQTSITSTNNWGSTKPTSPLRGSSFNPTKTYYILGVGGTKSNTFIPGQQLWLEWNSNSKAFIIKGMLVGSNTPYSGTISIKVTKIERYY